MNETLIALITTYASMYGIDPKLAVAVAQIESSLNPKAIGSKGEIGLFQLMPSTYPKMSKVQLLDPKTNIRLGVLHLQWNKNNCKHKKSNTFLVCYNYGVKNAERVRYPQLFPYYKKVMAQMKKLKDGQKVMVSKLHEFRIDGEGTYLGMTKDPHQSGMHRVLNEYGHVMLIEAERIFDYEEYWNSKKSIH